ncbi:MAG: class I SAM-dependent methyltransferase [Acidobacteriaceae bacterium]
MSASAPSTSGPSIEQIKQGMRATWMAGDFGAVAKINSGGAEAFAARLPITAGQRVLDVATGTGNLALPIARRGAIVTGVDIATNLIEQARERAAAEGIAATFDEGDAEHLPYPDASFDAAVTMFGAMFAPRPELVASEFARVLRPGGLLAMANWNPGSFSGKLFRVGAQYLAPPPGIERPVMWGDEATVRARLEAHFEDIRTELVPIVFKLPTNPAGAVEFFRRYFGPTQMVFNRLDPEGQKAFAADLEAMWASANTSTDAEQTVVNNEYLEVTARRKH